MAAIHHVFTLQRAAQILGRDEDLLWELADQLEPEDGVLWILDIDDKERTEIRMSIPGRVVKKRSPQQRLQEKLQVR